MAFSRILLGAGTKPTRPVVRRISASDLMQAITRGYNDFAAMPSHAVFLCVIYPLLGLLLIAMTLGYSMSLAFSARGRVCPHRTACSDRPLRAE